MTLPNLKDVIRRGGKNATAYDKLSSMPDEESAKFRDVHNTQQLDRGNIEKVSSKRPRRILAIAAGVIVFLLLWIVFGIFGHGVKTLISPDVGEGQYTTPLVVAILLPAWWKIAIAGIPAVAVFFVSNMLLMRNWHAQNLKRDTSDINQYHDDQFIQPPEMIIRNYHPFPDLGAHSRVEVNSMISHIMISNKGIKPVEVGVRAEEDSDQYLKGELMVDENGEYITKKVPFIDEETGMKLYEASGMTVKKYQKFFDVSKIPYNPGDADRTRLKGYETIADLANGDWELPIYEPQRPSGVYIVDSDPVNTMILAITRAGKGQTYIEPVIDMWLREINHHNMVINDPKGELLVKHYVRATIRGYQVVQFNLINAVKTDIYNPLGLAADASREGDTTKAAQYVENIAEVFFPVDGADDPVWPNAASNAFKRAAYGVIDYYLEEERELRKYAMDSGMSVEVLETRLDEMWGKVTLYNCYQLFVQLTAKKVPKPSSKVNADLETYGDEDVLPEKLIREYGVENFKDLGEEGLADLIKRMKAKDDLWGGEDEIDMLTLYFNATAKLPRNSMRTLVANADNALRSMGAADKMIGSVYGIAITAMNFFVDPTISMLTSGTPSQNTDLAGLSFPRRIGVRFAAGYMEREHLQTMQAKWDAFADADFTESLGKDFEHEDTVSREGWARYYFKGIFPERVAYLRLQMRNPQTKMTIKSFYFKFTKTDQMSLDGRTFMRDPVTGQKVVKNGLLEEMIPSRDGVNESTEGASVVVTSETADLMSKLNKTMGGGESGTVSQNYTFGSVTYPQERLTNLTSESPEKVTVQSNAIIQKMVRYSEKPKAVFLVTPPHLAKYAKLILILIKQLVDLNFEQSYMTKSNQKPLYKTRFMLDELGNLQSDGHGISSFETMLSIGLGQEQQFTLILQTLQQLKAVYGDDVDKIVQGNAQPLDALIATDNGWKPMGEITTGDRVVAPAGRVAAVDGVFPQGERKVFTVQTDQGQKTRACDEHLWDVELDVPEGVDIESILG